VEVNERWPGMNPQAKARRLKLLRAALKRSLENLAPRMCRECRKLFQPPKMASKVCGETCRKAFRIRYRVFWNEFNLGSEQKISISSYMRDAA